ncbi:MULTISPECIES: HIT family protein [Halomicrobium]|uniref:Histidine triad (HIT) protein n=2 Tax=Halomicrobium mukohataei TaxID=57705 RepID=C7P1G9_HALMD|nr:MULTISPECIES: HIT family protein [Halomicrobium]ACV47177.1 histidine triad (HIT) protein [Halomicrobium mukohataei DSM 12286]QCD65655.1 HIT family protein [Halomicrobium mukohataei]QFR20461.1 HIT domain-containing protein [Halomicrobium sp. ZPS1]
MSEDCIFCSIVDGDIPGRIVHETDDAVAFLDANPLARGHTLVIPKSHHERLDDVPAEEATGLYSALHEVVPAVEAAVDAPATTVAFNNGEDAGQEVPHVHAHVVPRFEGDGGGPIHAMFGSRPDLSDDELDEIEAAIEP